MILQMLSQVNFPLTESQISDFFLSKDYTNYFTLKESLSELVESGLISVESIHNTSRYENTSEGSDTLGFFGNKIPAAILDDIDKYLKENKFKMRNEVNTTSDYYLSTMHEYVVHCEVREGKSTLIGLDLTVPDEEQAKQICDNWKEKSGDVYQNIMKALM